MQATATRSYLSQKIETPLQLDIAALKCLSAKVEVCDGIHLKSARILPIGTLEADHRPCDGIQHSFQKFSLSQKKQFSAL